jgi:hypothetical protein
MNELCFIVPYFGKEPIWFKYFLRSVEKNRQYQWLLFTDFELSFIPVNTIHKKISLVEFKSLVSNRLGVKTNIVDPYKICDFKPAFGQIFSDFIKDYKYWAYCDADIIIGNILSFLSKVLQSGYDIISPDKDFFPGHFCIFRNTKEINELYQQADNYINIFKSRKNYYFDEILVRKGLLDHSDRKRVVQKVFFKQKIIQKVKQVFPGLKKYGRRKSNGFRLIDFNSVIKNNILNSNLKVFHERLYESDFTFKVNGLKQWKVNFKNGHVYYGGKELLYFHFQLSKDLKDFTFVEIDDDKFFLEKY